VRFEDVINSCLVSSICENKPAGYSREEEDEILEMENLNNLGGL